MDDSKTVALKIENNIAVVTLQDPDTLNAMTEQMSNEFSGVLADLKKQYSLRALIITGQGRAFSAGGHLDMLKSKVTKSGESNRLDMLAFYRSFLGLLDLNVPLIAAINGTAIGAGLSVACACDIRIASSDAKLGFTFTRLGLHPGMGTTFFLPRIVGRAAASELLLTSRIISAEKALALGLVSQLTTADAVLSTAQHIAKEISACGPEATRQLLATLRSDDQSLSAALDREALCQGINYASKEFSEGLTAISEKRPAQFVMF